MSERCVLLVGSTSVPACLPKRSLSGAALRLLTEASADSTCESPARAEIGMSVRCEIDGCAEQAQAELTTSGYELCASHYEQWSTKNMFVVEERGKAVLVPAATHPGGRGR